MKDCIKIYEAELASIREAGTYKDERIITTPQRSRICLLYTSDAADE